MRNETLQSRFPHLAFDAFFRPFIHRLGLFPHAICRANESLDQHRGHSVGLWKHGNLWPAIASLSPTMSGYPRPAAGAYYTLAPQQTYGLPAQQPSPSDLRPPPPQGPSSQSPNFTLPPGVPLHANPRDLIVELCRIIERQSQEIVAMRQGRSQERGASVNGRVKRDGWSIAA